MVKASFAEKSLWMSKLKPFQAASCPESRLYLGANRLNLLRHCKNEPAMHAMQIIALSFRILPQENTQTHSADSRHFIEGCQWQQHTKNLQFFWKNVNEVPNRVRTMLIATNQKSLSFDVSLTSTAVWRLIKASRLVISTIKATRVADCATSWYFN